MEGFSKAQSASSDTSLFGFIQRTETLCCNATVVLGLDT